MSQTLLSLLEPTAVCLQLDAQDAAQVITTLGNLLYQAGYVRGSFVAAALDRESRLPTGLPLSGEVNAAIPHTEIEHVLKPGLAMATLRQPVTFRNMVMPEESVPVRLVFVMALDRPKAQVEMLQEIAGVLQDPTVIDRLVAANTYQEVRAALTAALPIDHV